MKNELGAEKASTATDAADVRILRRLDLATGPTPDGRDEVEGVGVAVNVGTTEPDSDVDRVVELAARRFTFDADHVITRIDQPYRWRLFPGRPAVEGVVRPGGPAKVDAVDFEEARRVLASASIRIAHDARLHRPFLDRLIPALTGLSWACSMKDVGWAAHGFRCDQLALILGECGFFHDAHGGSEDVDATIQILRREVVPERTALSLLMEHAARESWLVRAFGAPFPFKDALRKRGYRWDGVRRVWWREVRDRHEEEAWLSTIVYAGRASQGGPGFERVDWTSRYA